MQPSIRATLIWVVVTILALVLTAQWAYAAGFGGFFALQFVVGFGWAFFRARRGGQ